MYYKKILFMSICSITLTLFSHHKIVYIIAPPRSLSTVFLRMMQARGDMVVYNEPAQYSFFKQFGMDHLCAFFPHTPFHSYDAVKQALINAAKTSNVCVKDISFAAYECFYDDEQFLMNPDIEFCFLIRDPHSSLVSYYNTKSLTRMVDGTEWIIEWITYERLSALFDTISTIRNKKPIVISCEDLTDHPETIIKHFCSSVEIDYRESMISWPSLQGQFDPLAWHDYKGLELCNQWHKNAIESTHFSSCKKSYEVDEEGKPTFRECEQKHRNSIIQIYNYSLPFYQKLYRHRLQPEQ